MTRWQESLVRLSMEASFMPSKGLKESKNMLFDTPLENANYTMQQRYPGPYIVEEYFDSKKIMFQYRLKFETPADETFWMIQQS
jgi:hypothetical protein